MSRLHKTEKESNREIIEKLEKRIGFLEKTLGEEKEKASQATQEAAQAQGDALKAQNEVQELKDKLVAVEYSKEVLADCAHNAVEDFKKCEEGEKWVAQEMADVISELARDLMSFVNGKVGPGVVDWAENDHCKQVLEMDAVPQTPGPVSEDDSILEDIDNTHLDGKDRLGKPLPVVDPIVIIDEDVATPGSPLPASSSGPPAQSSDLVASSADPPPAAKTAADLPPSS